MMFNICNNHLQVIGDEEEALDLFSEDVQGRSPQYASYKFDKETALWEKDGYIERGPDSLLSLNSLLTVPEEILESGYGHPKGQGFDWQRTNWGTRMDAFGVTRGRREKEMVYSFKTAWQPPIEWLIHASAVYSDFLFVLKYYEDEGGYFWGKIHFNRGVADYIKYDEDLALDNMPRWLRVRYEWDSA